jgi:hypothetical protein
MADLAMSGVLVGARGSARVELVHGRRPRSPWAHRIASFLEPGDLREQSHGERVLEEGELRRQARVCFAPWQ